jgi:hypothetical protein
VHPNSGSGLRRRACSLLGFAREDLGWPLSRPTLPRRTPIATTALPFVVRVGPEGAVSVRMVAQQRGLQGYGSSMGETNVYGAPSTS